MVIAFQCPKCAKPYKVKDELAGKRATCQGCKSPMAVPNPNAPPPPPPPSTGALDMMALDALSDDAAQAEQAAAEVIKFECEYCFEAIELPAALAGKKNPCPSCRRIITIPAPKVQKPKDWRSAPERFAGAKENAAAPEGAWGNAQAGTNVVSRTALVDAGVMVDRKRPPWSTSKKILFGMIPVLLLALGVIGWRMRGLSVARESRTELFTLVFASGNKPTDAGPGVDAALQTAAGSFHLGESPPDIAVASESFRKARAAIRGVENAPEKVVLMTELAVAQSDLGGDEAQVQANRRKSWEEAFQELRQTIQPLREIAKDRDRDAAALVLQPLASALRLSGPVETPVIKSLAYSIASTGDERSDFLSMVGLQLLSQGPNEASFAAELAKTAKSEQGGAPSANLMALLLAVKHAEVQSTVPALGAGEPAAPIRWAYVAGLSRTGDAADLEKAKAISRLPGAFEGRLAGLVALAEATSSAADLDEAVALAEANLKATSVSPWLLIRLGRLCENLRKPDQARRLANAVGSGKAKGFLEMAAVRADPAAAAAAALEAVSDPTAQTLAAIAMGRAGAKNGLTRKDVITWPAGRAGGYAGLALGLLPE